MSEIHNSLPQLVAALEKAGCTVSAAPAFRAVAAAALPSPPEVPDDVLGMSVDQIEEHLAEMTKSTLQGQQSAMVRHSELKARAAEQLRASMVAEADDYVRALRPAWDAAADAARHVRKLGVEPTDTPEQVMRRGAEASAAWLEFRDKYAPVLERIAGLRARLARIGTTPGPDADVTPALTRPHSLNVYPGDPRADVAPHVRWLSVAASLHLCTEDELDPDIVLKAQGENVGDLKRAAQNLQAWLAEVNGHDSAAATASRPRGA